MNDKHPLSQFRYCPKCGANEFVENNIKSKKCNSCGFVYYFNPSASTVALIVNEKNELLVATRSKDPAKGTFDLPGGFVDMHESAEDAMRREVKEETNLDVDDLKYLFSTVNIYKYSGFDVHTVDLVFLCKVKHFEEMKADDDVARLNFISISELKPELFGLDSVRRIIKNINNIQI